MDEKILPTIHSPQDLCTLDEQQMTLLCAEIRQRLIEVVTRNGGHLASNLGVVELTCCLEKVFCSPDDTIVFDVGHQSYTHKLLTGRQARFDTLRQEGGLSGFLRPDESPYDAFVTGHSSTAVSVALGYAAAKQLTGKPGSVVAVVGDGAMTGGLFYEALDNVVQSDAKVVIVINDNEMSISPNIGGMSKHLTKLTSRESYFNFKDFMERFLKGIPLIGGGLFKAAVGLRDAVKRLLRGNTIFSDMGIRYLGPVDGHDLRQLTAVFERAKKLKSSVVVHCITVKGKGYEPARQQPDRYHALAPEGSPAVHGFSEAFGQALCEMADRDARICAITAAMGEGTGLEAFAARFPTRYFDVGIAEQHGVCFGAALAAGGERPFFAVYSSFLQRGYDQLVHDVAIGRYPLTVCIDRAGFVGSDGATHNGLLDVAFINSIPDFTFYAPSDFAELRLCMSAALLHDGPVAIRYPKGGEPEGSHLLTDTDDWTFAEPENAKVTLIGYGRTAAACALAAQRLNQTEVTASVLKLVRIKPIAPAAVAAAARGSVLLFVEEAHAAGSVGSLFLEQLQSVHFTGRFIHLTVPEEFCAQAPVSQLLHRFSLDAAGIVDRVHEILADGGEAAG